MPYHVRPARLVAILLGTTALCTAPARAIDNWTGTTSSNWQTSTNWTNGTPTAADMVVIDGKTANSPVLSGASTQTTGAMFVGATSVGSLTISSNAGLSNLVAFVGDQSGAIGTVTVKGAGTDWVTTGGSAWSPGATLDPALVVGNFGKGTVQVSSGAQVGGGTVVVGEQAGSTGLVTVDGTGTQFGGMGPQGSLLVGYAGAGTLNVGNGGAAIANAVVLGVLSGSTGGVTVDGAGSRFYAAASPSSGSGGATVGSAGNGSVSVSNGGALIADSWLTIGGAGSGIGTVSVSGAGSNLTVGTGAGTSMLVVGWNGTGTLNMASGASGSVSGALILGNAPSGSGTLNLSGSGTSLAVTAPGGGSVYASFAGSGAIDVSNAASLTTDKLFIGYQGPGTLTVESGAAVTANSSLVVGSSAASSGTVTVTGVGSTLSVGSASLDKMTVGDMGSGTLNVLAGGHVVVNGLTNIGESAGGRGAVTVDGAGSRLTLNNGGYVGLAGAGTLTVSNGGQVTAAQSVNVGFNGAGSMTVTGVGSQLTVTGNDLWIARNGAATVNVRSGGAIHAQNLDIGIGTAAGAVTVDGAGSSMQLRSIVVGYSNTSPSASQLLVSNGASVTAGSGTLGFNTGASGVATVTGAGSSLNLTSTSSANSLVIGGLGDGALAINNGGSVTAAGNVVIAQQSGSTGQLYIGSAGGTPATAPGTLTAAGIQFGAGTGDLVFNHTSSAYVFSVPISGNGIIDNLAGHTILTGDSAGFTGFAAVAGGTLSINGSLANGNVSVQNGGTLGGIGTIGTLYVGKGGILAPGNSIGTLTVAQDATFVNGSFYQVQLDAKGNSDRLVVGTTTLIKGGTVEAQVQAGNYTGSTKYTILTSAGGITGTFAGVASDAAFLTPSLSYDANDVYLTMTRNAASFASVGTTRNQIATGGAVDPLGYGNAIWNAVVTLNAAQARTAFDQLSGDIHPSTLGVLVEDSRFMRAAAIDRLREAFRAVGAGGRSAMAYAADPAMVKPDASFTVWGRAIGSWGEASTDGNAAALSHNTGGFFSGIDGRVGDDWRVGALSGYTRANLSSASDASSASVDSYHVGGFAGAQWGAIGFRSGAAYSWHHIDSSRSVVIPGFADRLASGYGATTAQMFGELGYRVDLSRRAALEPFVALAYVDTRGKGFAETGGIAALTGAASGSSVGFSTFGSRGAVGFEFGGFDAHWTGMLGWRHAYGDVTPTTAMSFAGGNVFTVAGLPIARDAAVVEAGLDLTLTRNATFGVSYSGQFAKRANDNGVKADLSWKF